MLQAVHDLTGLGPAGILGIAMMAVALALAVKDLVMLEVDRKRLTVSSWPTYLCMVGAVITIVEAVVT